MTSMIDINELIKELEENKKKILKDLEVCLDAYSSTQSDDKRVFFNLVSNLKSFFSLSKIQEGLQEKAAAIDE